MRKICFLLIFLALPFLVCAQNIPQATGWVNDFAGVISPEYRDKINALIEELEQKTTAEIAVVTINSIAPYDEKEYARLLFDSWKPGKKSKDNGVLVLLAIKERRWRIETGYGVEGVLPDGLCGEIGRNYMVPYFKEGKYGEGLYQGALKISQIIARDANVNLKTWEGFKDKLPWDSIAPIIFLLFIIVFIIAPIFLFNYLYNKRTTGYGDNTGINYHSNSWGSGWGSGGFGGGGFGGGGGGGGGAGGGGF